MTRYFAVQTSRCGGYLNANGKCVDRGWVLSEHKADAQKAAGNQLLARIPDQLQ